MPMPNFLLIGAQKCGTDALYYALQQHPDIYMSPHKEPFFFMMDGKLPTYRLPGPRYTNGLVYDWNAYLQLFAGATNQKAIGEASAIYLSSYFPEKTAARIRQRIPDAKIIALVRQPADRAYSAFNFYHARDFEPLASFAQALAAEPARIQANDTPDFRHRMNGYYYANLKPYFDLFPREQIRIYLYEDWNASPTATLQDIFRFLGVEETVPIAVQRRNVTYRYHSKRLGRFLLRQNRSRRWWLRQWPRQFTEQLDRWNRVKPPPISRQIWRALTAGYREDILNLQTLTGRDLSHWLHDDR
ncbi:hypothetical protein BH10CHL1_BH10CHL1_40790 [soil metagenome]